MVIIIYLFIYKIHINLANFSVFLGIYYLSSSVPIVQTLLTLDV
jgi:hypothetical protein